MDPAVTIIIANLLQIKKLANGPWSYNKKRFGPGGSDREMNLDYRLTPAKCGLPLHLCYEKKTSSKNSGAVASSNCHVTISRLRMPHRGLIITVYVSQKHECF